jgi:4'-phosphopantetheinyl transferase EntD
LTPDIDELFPGWVLTVTSPIDATPEDLFPQERSSVAKAVRHRQCEFATGRVRARELLVRLGLPDAVVPVGPDRSPVWPEGIVGSISHTHDLCAVTVARQAQTGGLGIDVEPDEPLDDETLSSICTPRELAGLGSLAEARRGRAARRLFRAKESVFKCQYPVTGSMPGFRDVEIEFDRASDAFEAASVTAGSADLPPIRGRWLNRDAWVFTSAVLR